MQTGTDSKISEFRIYSCGYCINSSRLMFRSTLPEKIHFPAKVLLLTHRTRGHILVDTGYGPGLYSKDWKTRLYGKLNPAYWSEEEGIAAQLEKDSIAPEDINRIILTHLHPDHIGGLMDFPQAPVTLSRPSAALLKKPRIRDILFQQMIPSDIQERSNPVDLHGSSPLEEFQGMDLLGDQSLWLMDLPGHARGQMGVYLPGHELFYLADALWGMEFLNKKLRLIPRWIQHHYGDYINTIEKIRRTRRKHGNIRWISSHGKDTIEVV